MTGDGAAAPPPPSGAFYSSASCEGSESNESSDQEESTGNVKDRDNDSDTSRSLDDSDASDEQADRAKTGSLSNTAASSDPLLTPLFPRGPNHLHFISIPLSHLQTLHLARVLFAYTTSDPETKLPVIIAERISEVDFMQMKVNHALVIFAEHSTEGRDYTSVLHLKNSRVFVDRRASSWKPTIQLSPFLGVTKFEHH